MIAILVILYVRATNNPVGKIVLFLEFYVLVDIMINGPHFMASYRLLYRKKSNLRKHAFVAIVLPAFLVLFIGYVTFQCFTNPGSPTLSYQFKFMEYIAPALLGWHWVGQSWGTTASFAFLSGFRMDQTERRLIRSGFHALFVYNCVLALQSMGHLQGGEAEGASFYLSELVMPICRIGVLACFFLGIWGFTRMARRENKKIPMRVWIPWLATFSWYLMVDVSVSSLTLVQGFHALQYLIFPARVEINDHTQTTNRGSHLFKYYVVLIVCGVIGFHWADIFGWVHPSGALDSEYKPIAMATFITLNIHHYFTDAVIWKIRDPEVRKSIFGHLEPAAEGT